MSDDATIGLDDARARWRRWEPSDFDATPGAAAGEPAPVRRAEEIATRIRQARQAAHEQAREEGRAQGYAEGMRAGLEEGRAAGHDEGYRAGYDSGHAEGRAQGAEQAAAESARLAALADACARSLAALEDEVGSALASLSLRIAEHIVRGTLDLEPERIVELVRQVLGAGNTGQDDALTIRVHPVDLELVRRYLQDEHPEEKWRLCATESVAPGGCLVQSALGAVDATLETRWHNVKAALAIDLPRDKHSHEH
jgi:flagellar assembly protein FliH